MTTPSRQTAAIRRFVCFPDLEDLVPQGAARLTDFRLLIAFESGLVGSFWSRARTLPQPEDFLEFDHVLRDMSRRGWTTGKATQVAVEELGLNLEAIDHALDDAAAWNVDAHLAAAMSRLAATVPPDKLAARREAFAEAARTRLQAALDAFMATLDPEILAIVGNGHSVLPSHYNYFAAGDPVLRRNRLQGWRSFPLAFRYLTEPLPPSFTVSALSRAIDAGEPLVPLLATRSKISRAAARGVLACPPDAAISPWRCDLHRMGEALDRLEPSFRPRSVDDWRALHAVSRGLRDLLRHNDDGSLFRRWLNDIARDGWDIWGPDEAHGQAFLVIEETVRAAVEVAAARVRASQVAARRAAFDCLGRKRFASAARLGQGWETSFQREQDRVALEGAPDSGVRWPVPLNTFSTPERTIVALDTPELLYAEGKAMNHCVGSYVGQCLAGLNQIWSVRTLSGERCSTLATRFADGREGGAFVAQNKGPGNRRPDSASEAAAEALIAHMQEMREELGEYHAWRTTAERRYGNDFSSLTELLISEAALRSAVPELLDAVTACKPEDVPAQTNRPMPRIPI